MRYGEITPGIYLTGLLLLFTGLSAQAQSTQALNTSIQSAAQIQAYWTPERMAAARPMPSPTRIDGLSSDIESVSTPTPVSESVWLPGWNPNSGRPQPTLADMVTVKNGSITQGLAQPQFASYGTAPTNPKDGPYGPFQRRSLMGKYVNFPRSILGKLFFTLNGTNYVCSGTVVSGSTVLTAGHCNSDGAGTYATNSLFCPSYNAGGINPNVGCWPVTSSDTSRFWHDNGDPDYDYACLITAATGTVVNDTIGNVTGWAGHQWGVVSKSTVVAFGYPAVAPFNGNNIVQVNAPMWYTWDANTGGQVSNVIGNDMTDGADGGGWFVSWNHPSVEASDTDNNKITDPYDVNGPYIVGVNSHKRCATNCNSPPTTTQGIFWQEMTSPPFNSNPGGLSERDVFLNCITNGG